MRWLSGRPALAEFERRLQDPFAAAQRIASVSHWPGRCSACGHASGFVVRTGAYFEDRPNLREGLRCAHCRLTARQRTLLLALDRSLDPALRPRCHVFERLSRLFRAIRRRYPRATGSEYLSPRHRSGRRGLWRAHGRPWRFALLKHESVTAMSHASASLDAVVHSDVLEHVADTDAAIRESHRVLRPGGLLLFTVPFFASLDTTLTRGRIDDAGRLVELLPGEYHGDGVRSGGAYTFYNFGWDLHQRLRSAFAQVELGVVHAPHAGFVHADPSPGDWNMLPLVFRCRR